MRTILLLVLAIFLVPCSSSALVGDGSLGEISVTLEGAVRTKLPYMEYLVTYCLEKGGYRTWDSIDSAGLRQCIINSRHFSSVEVAVKQPDIVVTVKDRWTLIPIPNMYAGKDRKSAGVFVYDSNFLGYGKIVGIGGAVAQEGNTYTLIYFDPAVHFTRATFRTIASESNAEVNAYDKTTVIYGFDKTEAGFTISPGYRITPLITLAITARYSDKRYSQLEDFAVPLDYTSWSAGARASYRDADYKLFYNDGFSANIEWSRQIRRSDQEDRIANTTADLEWDLALFKKHALQLGLHGAAQSSAVTEKDVATFGRSKGYRGIQFQGLWSRRIAAASVDYQIPVAMWGHGTVTVAPFLDYGTCTPFFEGTGNNYRAYGIGVYYYVNFISFPGIGLTAGVNDQFMGTFVGLQIGLPFN